MRGWLVNDRLTCIPGTRTLWHALLDGIPGLEPFAPGSYDGLAEAVEARASIEPPDYVIRNAAYFRRMRLPCPQISFVQDIIPDPVQGDLTVFNTEFTGRSYPPMDAVVIPVGTDFGLFRPRIPDPQIPSESVLFVGSGDAIKGWPVVQRLAVTLRRPLVCVLKDDVEAPGSAIVYRRVPQERLARIASSCAVGIVPSLVESQHLAGIEMGACGLPLVTTNTGIYWNRPSGPWGKRVENWEEDIESVAALDRTAVRDYWLSCSLDMASCVRAWNSIVENVCRRWGKSLTPH